MQYSKAKQTETSSVAGFVECCCFRHYFQIPTAVHCATPDAAFTNFFVVGQKSNVTRLPRQYFRYLGASPVNGMVPKRNGTTLLVLSSFPWSFVVSSPKMLALVSCVS